MPEPRLPCASPTGAFILAFEEEGQGGFSSPVIDVGARTVRFEIALKGEAPRHTFDRTGARCLFCDTFIKKRQLREHSQSHMVCQRFHWR